MPISYERIAISWVMYITNINNNGPYWSTEQELSLNCTNPHSNSELGFNHSHFADNETDFHMGWITYMLGGSTRVKVRSA